MPVLKAGVIWDVLLTGLIRTEKYHVCVQQNCSFLNNS